MYFDNEEKLISDALAALDLELETPDLMPGIRKKLSEKRSADVERKSRHLRKPLRFIGLVAAIVSVTGITAAAISLGGFDWLLKKVSAE